MNQNRKLKILFVTSELFPFMKTGGLADISSSLPKMLAELGNEVRILVPKYGSIDTRKYKIHDVVRLKDIIVKLGKEDVSFSLKSSFLPSQKVRVQIYFLDNEVYFGNRKGLYSDIVTGESYEDNHIRFSLFSKAVFELILRLGWTPDIIHCNDWQTGLVPAYYSSVYKKYEELKGLRILYTVHSFANQGVFPKKTFKFYGLPESMLTNETLLHKGKINFLRAGLSTAHHINTVSKSFVQEVLDNKSISDGLNDVLIKRKKCFYGVLNGIDNTVWNPETDKLIPQKYSVKNIRDKFKNKAILANKFGLPYKEDVPLVALISRLTEEKGIGLFIQSFEKLKKLGLQFIVLGMGDKEYHKQLTELRDNNPEDLGLYLGFDDDLAHIVEAGADMFLLPSKYEPCGLNQMYSLRYGTVPVARLTGGFADTIQEIIPEKYEGNGIFIENFTAASFIKSLTTAIKYYNDKTLWFRVIINGMSSDFSWMNSAKSYVELYNQVLK